jgi:KaiC/GvpD/RAD55 family RecA-like ATPase
MMHEDGPVTYSIDRVAPKPLRWLWDGVIPRGKLTVLAGDPGMGKSLLTLDVASRASSGAGWPCGAPGVGASAVVLLSAEDDPADTVRPRLEGLGADLSRVVVLDSVREQGRYADFDLSCHTPELREAIAAAREAHGDVGLVVIDPVSAFVGATDSYNNAHVRAMLKPLAEIAADEAVAVVLVTHLRKSAEGPAVQRAMGSLAFAAAARVVLMATRHPDDPGLRVLSCAKSNLAPDRRAFLYAIEDDAGRPRPVWHGQFAGSTDELLAGGHAPGRRTSVEMLAFTRAVHEHLAREGRLPLEMAEALATRHGVAWATAKAVESKRRMGVRSVREDGAWAWVAGEEQDE